MNDILAEIKARLEIFPGIYDHIRIVNPVDKTQTGLDQGDNPKITAHCHRFWGTGGPCENCVSMRVLNSRKPAHKIEIKDNHIYLIQALPVVIGNDRHIVEMIQEVERDQIVLKDRDVDLSLQEFVRRLNNQLVVDELTKVFNRRYIDERLPTDLKNAQANGQQVTIAMADIDLFKNINDTYGHTTGDHVLEKVAEIIKSSIRASLDWVARYGGEEFVIVLNDISKEESYQVIEKIRVKIENQLFKYKEETFKVTCSFGLAEVTQTEYDFNKIIDPVDACLYQAKTRGRNRTVAR